MGLTLKRAGQHPEMVDYILRPYRFLTAPREIDKGRVQLVMALHQTGMAPEAIAACCGCARRVVERQIEDFEAGRAMAVTDFFGKILGTRELCRLHGALAGSPD